jgi:hypothetical protein
VLIAIALVRLQAVNSVPSSVLLFGAHVILILHSVSLLNIYASSSS